MKYLIVLLPFFLIVNLAGVLTKNIVLIAISVVIIAIYYAGKALVRSHEKPPVVGRTTGGGEEGP